MNASVHEDMTAEMLSATTRHDGTNVMDGFYEERSLDARATISIVDAKIIRGWYNDSSPPDTLESVALAHDLLQFIDENEYIR